MPPTPASIAAFLASGRLAVAGVSRDPRQTSNVIFRRLRDTGHEVVPLNPNTTEVEGVTCYPSLDAVPGRIGGVMVATHPAVAAEIVRQCGARGVKHVWFHRSFGDGSVSQEAVRACGDCGITPIVGGCPLMYCGKVDLAHRCMRWWLSRRGRISA